MINFLLFLFLSLPVNSAVKVEMDFSSSEATQGELIEAKLRSDPPGEVDLLSFKGKTIGKTVHFYDVLGDNNAKVIFIKVPSAHEELDTVGGKELILNWGGMKVIPVESEKSLLFGTFTIPKQSHWVVWISAALLIIVMLSVLFMFVTKSVKRKRAEKERLLELKKIVLDCRQYDDVINLWKRKHELGKTFPHIEEPFQKMEVVLNRYQFKPSQSETEKAEIIEAYKKFQRSVEGGFFGI